MRLRHWAATTAAAITLGPLVVAAPVAAQNTPEPPLERGDAGAAVESLQTLLNDFRALGASTGPLIREDAIFGPSTEAALEAFEQSAGLEANGVATRADIDLLNATVESLEESSAASTVRQGDSGPLVENWQMALNDRYRLTGSNQNLIAEDGVFGATTTSATRLFEKASGLQVDGIVEPIDRAAMRETLDDLRGSGDLPPLVIADRGKVVENAQDLLNDYLALSASATSLIREDAIFGPNTRAAAVEFETAAGLVVDGVLTRSDLVTLRRNVENLEATLPESIVQQGSTGNLVEVWQMVINDWIFYTDTDLDRLNEDGVFGVEDTEATTAFEAYAGLQVDGIVEPVDRSTMRSTLEALRNQPPEAGTMAAAQTLGEFITASDYQPEEFAQILRLYPAFFNREADIEGAKYWIIDTYLRDRQSIEQITQFFASPNQPEFVQFYADIPAGDHNAYLTRVYANMLDRAPDPAGLAYWVAKMDSGALDRGGVVRYVARNAEFIVDYPYGQN